jgi:5'-3' exonuclease
MPVTINISGLDGVRQMLDSINMDDLCKEVANELKADIKHRIHVEGKAADGSKIGTYSEGYMKVRTGNYEETKLKSGKNKGKFREEKTKGQAGVFTKGPRKGQPRPVYNRKGGENDTDVVLSLTRQMEKDLEATNPIKIDGGYGIGFTNDFNAQKAEWNDKRYGKKVYALTKEEEKKVHEIVDNYIERITQ